MDNLHVFLGRSDRDCEVCGLSDRHPIHVTSLVISKIQNSRDDKNWIGTYKCVEEGTKALVVSRARMIDEVSHKPVTVWIGFVLSKPGLRLWNIVSGIWDNDGNYLDKKDCQWNLVEAIRETS